MTARENSIFLPKAANQPTHHLALAVMRLRADPAKCLAIFMRTPFSP